MKTKMLTKKMMLVLALVAIAGTIVPAGRAPAQALVLTPATVRAAASAAGLGSLANVAVPQVNNIADFLNPGPGAKSQAVVLGKALFWDMQVGSDGIMACASCHFAAGADSRVKNQWNPGMRAVPPDTAFGNPSIEGTAGWPQFGPNYSATADDFPTHELAGIEDEDFSHRVIVHSTDDVASSQGIFKANFVAVVPGQATDLGTVVADDIFHVGDVNVRRVEPRNTPSVIGAVFNFDNFLDGRARNQFNGVNPLGPLDDAARILVNDAGTLVQRQVSIPNSSLASQAVGPPLSDLEMSYAGRTFPDVGKKLLAARPLALQQVHAEDSVLGAFSRAGQALPGLTFNSYTEMVQTVFQARYWSSDNVITLNPDGSKVINPPGTPGGYTQMEANFSLFFGLAIQAYESILIADRSRFDLFMEGDDLALDQDEMAGLLTFIKGPLSTGPLFDGIGQGGCLACHKSPTFSDATFSGMGLEGPIELELAPVLVDGILKVGTEVVLLDNGFYNIGVRPTSEDLGRGGSELGKPLSASRQALQGYPFAPRIPANAPQNPRVMVDGAFKVPILRNVELTAPYFHNGGQLTLRDVMEFYRRHGDFSDVNIAHLDGPLATTVLRQPDARTRAEADIDRLVKFLLALTDERVRYEMEPFDHPQLFLTNGHPGDSTAITEYDVVDGVKQAKDIIVELPATGRCGRPAEGAEPVRGYLSSGALQGIDIKLHPGWNILSTPVRLHSSIDTWGEFAAHNGLNYQAAYRWDGAAFQFLDPAYLLQPLEAVYVQVREWADVEIIPYEGVSAPPSRTLAPGWNLVGPAFLQTAMPASSALTSVYFAPNSGAVPGTVPLWGYSQVVSPTSNAFDWSYVREAIVVPEMLIGEGYWVAMVNEAQLSGFTSTPLLRPL